MTEIYAISHAEQMEAHRRDFLAWWTANILPKIFTNGLTPLQHYKARCQSQQQHWKLWREKNKL